MTTEMGRLTHSLLASTDLINWFVSSIFALFFTFEQMLANKNSRELSLQDGSDAGERHGKSRIEVLTCDFSDQSEPVGSGSDESVMKGSDEHVFLRRLSEEQDTLPRYVSEL